ncbi:MAG: glucosamine-6-phosphate deaminase [Provencibacterium sp.]|jgi:glucosamine-6-phosphate deaminase|nr:glucosamine-6-phosphate deaminase [Provencibacterium sp.]
MRILIAKDYDGMCRNGADLIAAQLLLKPNCVLGLATGSTPCGIYDRLAEKYSAGELDFSAVHSVNLDEYVGLPPENDQSYRYFMQKNLFDRVNIRRENTHVPNGLAEDIEAECRRYEQLTAAYGYPDLQLLGIGLNGHIGFNEPDESFPVATHRVSLTESTIQANSRFFKSLDEVPRAAVTMGIGTIMRARRILLAISGENKKEIARAAILGPVTPRVPASVLQLHPDVTVILDEAAAALL